MTNTTNPDVCEAETWPNGTKCGRPKKSPTHDLAYAYWRGYHEFVPRDFYEEKVTDPSNRRMRAASGRVNIDSKLTAFLYILARDFVTPGVIEDAFRKCADPETGIVESDNQYTNGWLALWADDLRKRLT